MSITITELQEKLKEAKSRITQKLNLTDLPFIPEEIRNMLLMINKNKEVIFRHSEISGQEEMVILKGEVKIHDFDLVNVAFHFKIVGEKVELSAHIPVKRTIPLSFGITKVKLTDVVIEINSESEENKKALLRGNVTLEEQTIELTRNLLGNELFEGTIINFSLNDLISTLCQRSIDSPIIPAITLQNAHFKVNPSSKGASVNVWANVDGIGRVQLSISKYSNSWEYIVIISLPDEWKLSSWSEIFRVFDPITIGEPKITLSSMTKKNVSVLDENSIVNSISVVEGLYFNGILKMKGAGLELLHTLFNIQDIPIGGLIGNDISDTTLNATFDDLTLFGITFNDAGIVLQVEPFFVVLELSTIVNIHREKLPFEGAVKLNQTGVAYGIAMPGVWHHPFGLTIFDISNVLLEFQTSPSPALAVAGNIAFGDDLEVKVVCRFMGNVPDTLIGTLQGELSTSRLISIFTRINIPSGFLDVSISNADIYIVANPAGAIIGEEHYPPGFRAHGEMNAFGISTRAKISIQENGIYLDGELPPINIGELLRIYGATTEQGPKVVYRAVRGEPFLFQLDAGLQLLGVTLETHILINQDGFRFEFTERIFNAFNAHVIATGTGELNQGNFHINATMQNDMIEFMTNETRQLLQSTASSADANVSNLEAQKRDFEQQISSLSGQMENRIQEITNARNLAENAVQSAMIVRDNAQNNLQNAENVRNSAIDALENATNTGIAISRDIENKQRELADILARIARIIFNPTELARLEEIRDRLRREISEFERSLSDNESLIRELQNARDRAIDSFNQAERALNDAINSLERAEEALRAILSPELDPIYIGFQTAKAAVEASLATVNSQLEAARVIVAKSAEILAYIAGQGMDLLFNVISIRFEGNIQNVGNGHVSLSISYNFLGATNTLNSDDFAFLDPRAGIQALVNRLMHS